MQKILIPLFTMASIATSAHADGTTDYSNLIATQGLSSAATTLHSIPDPTPSDQFALGGVRFLGAVEHALQTRYRTGIYDGLDQIPDIPFLRLPIPENPSPEPFTGEVLADMFQTIVTDLAQARAALDKIGNADTVAVSINTADLWFDINMNTRRDPGEDLLATAGMGFGVDPSDPVTLPPIRFDTADAAWLSAYAHLLSGISEIILAFDPATAIDKVIPAGAAMNAARGIDQYTSLNQEIPMFADLGGTIIYALERQPDVTRTRAAHAHFLDMIADNKTFWARVARETDNTDEWIPNATQISVLPIPFPPQTGAAWQAILADAEAVLNGDLLLPHWRLGDNAGINLHAMFQTPPPLDIAGVLQGWTVLPYVEQGDLIDQTSLMAFWQLVGSATPLYMIILN